MFPIMVCCLEAQDAEKAAGGGTLSDLTEAVLQSRPYFAAALSAYVFGLGLAFVANSVTHMGQPGAPFTYIYAGNSMSNGFANTARMHTMKRSFRLTKCCRTRVLKIDDASETASDSSTDGFVCVCLHAALLYIVPSMLGTVAAMAVVRGELQSVLRFTHKANTVSDILRDASKPSDKSRTN